MEQELKALKAELKSLRSERTAWRVTAENAEKQLEDLKASIGEPVAMLSRRVLEAGNGTPRRVLFDFIWLSDKPQFVTKLYAIKEVK